MKIIESNPEGDKKETGRYEAPAIIYEGQITTRAGTPSFAPPPGEPEIDPGDLFGENGGRG